MRAVSRGVVIVGVVALLAAVPVASVAQNAPASGSGRPVTHAIVVVGQGTVEATPDQARITLGIESVRQTAQAAQSASSDVMDKIVQALTALGIPKERIRTASLDLSPQRKPGNPPGPITGYVATNQVTVIVDDLRLTGRAIDASINAGANEVRGLSFGLKDPTPYRTQALKLAVQDAQATAAALASAAGVGPIHLVRLEQGGTGAAPRVALTMQAQAATPVLPGQLQVAATVTAEYTF